MDYVCLWRHKADLTVWSADFRFRGMSGHARRIERTPPSWLLTVAFRLATKNTNIIKAVRRRDVSANAAEFNLRGNEALFCRLARALIL
jgi:hypothetical protein